MKKLKKYVAYNPDTFEFIGFYEENRKDLPNTVSEVDPKTFLSDKGTHTNYNPAIGWYTEEVVLTEEEKRKEFKQKRTALIENLTVTVGGYTFDADEMSRSRMADTIVGLNPDEVQLWVLADNSVIYPTREVLIEVLRAIGAAQTAVWVQQ